MPSNPLQRIWQQLGFRTGAGVAAFNLVIVGDAGCGKRSLLARVIRGVYPESYKIPAVIDSHRFNLHTADAALKLEILTIGFHENAREWLRQNSSWPHVVLVCFAIKSSDSFVSVVQQWMPVVRQYNPRTPIILVGCQKDYRDEDDGSLMTVDTAEALEYSAQIGAAAYIECSAQTGEGLIEVFGAVARVAVAAGLTG
ncbi:P-loop containing nucleoside triphosphate hydrolase protein [Zopfochytrium polystomum]|nr:P-loop containing nucleoside triphosphate hydrolase protein [Zopfochytrium polystomum]